MLNINFRISKTMIISKIIKIRAYFRVNIAFTQDINIKIKPIIPKIKNPGNTSSVSKSIIPDIKKIINSINIPSFKN